MAKTKESSSLDDVKMEQRYRKDRRELLLFLLKSNIPAKVDLPPGAVSLDDVDLDCISVDYVMQCIKEEKNIDISKAATVFYDELILPPSSQVKEVEIFYLETDPSNSGPPPGRLPPEQQKPPENSSEDSSENTPDEQKENNNEDDSEDEDEEKEKVKEREKEKENENDNNLIKKSFSSLSSLEKRKNISFDLPPFSTGISEQNLREAAYEILLSCVSGAGGLMPPVREKLKSEKKNIFKKIGYRNKHKREEEEERGREKEREKIEKIRFPGLVGLIEVIRENLQIDEEEDSRIRKALLHISSSNKHHDLLKINTVIIPLELLSSTPSSSFSSQTSYRDWSKRQLNILEEVLLYHSFMNIQPPAYAISKMKTLVSQFENAFNIPSPAGEAHQMDVVRLIRDFSSFILDFRSSNLRSSEFVLPESTPSKPNPDNQIVLYNQPVQNPSDQRYPEPRYPDPRYPDPRYPDPRYPEPRSSNPRWMHPGSPSPAGYIPRSQSADSSVPQNPEPRWQDPRSPNLRPNLRPLEPRFGEYQSSHEAKPMDRTIHVPMPVKSTPSNDVCHWADGYFINICFYSQLVKCCFDPIQPNKLVDQTEEMFELMKSTWILLGITQTIHDLIFIWALFDQFVLTSDVLLLQSAYNQLKKFPTKDKRNTQEKKYFQKLQSTVMTFYGPKIMNVIQSILRPIKKYFESYLLDYHLSFPKGGKGKMEYFLSTVLLISKILADEEDTSQDESISRMEEKKLHGDLCESFIKSSINNAYGRCLQSVEKENTSEEHRLTFLASKVHYLMKKEKENYSFVFKRYNSLSPAIAASILHSLFRKELKPFLDSVSVLTSEVNQVLPAGDNLEQLLLDTINDCISTADISSYSLQQKIKPYEVASVSATLVSRWIVFQISKMKEWTERALFIEEWEPVSDNVLHANSIVDVFRIINETLDQFFDLTLPMRINILKSLVVGIDEVLKLYVNKICDDLGNIDALFPSNFPLTRFSKNTHEKYTNKLSKNINNNNSNNNINNNNNNNNDMKSLDSKLDSKFKLFTARKLCIRINTLQFLLHQLEETENIIREKWILKRPMDENLIKITLNQNNNDNNNYKNNQNIGRKGLHSLDEKMNKIKQEKYDEFSAIFESSKKVFMAIMEWLCDYTATKVIMYDLRDSFFGNLYYGSASSHRVNALLPLMDPILGELCESIIDSLRDKVVIYLLKSSLDCFMRVILDGGPSRAFSILDSRILEDDLENLKDFFIADGEGLPKSLVDNVANPIAQILKLFTIDTGTVLEKFRQHSHASLSGINEPSKVRLVYSINEPDTIFRVLCHRADREASQYLKKYFQLPKNLE